MSIEIGVLLAIGGCLAALVGLSSMRRARQLKAHGVAVWAMTVQLPEPAGEQERRGRILLQYTLEDGRVVERIGPSSARSGARLEPGQKILIWYDPDDPGDVLIFGRSGRRSDWSFVIGGMLLIGGAVLVAALG